MNARITLTFFFLFLAMQMGIHGPVQAIPDISARPVRNFARLEFTGTAMTDNDGNFIGMTIPLKRAGRLLLLEGVIDNISGNFILDTGAESLVLNKTYFRNYLPSGSKEAGGITGSAGKIERIGIDRLQLSEISFTNLVADVTSLGHLENRRGVKILGLVGMALLKNLEFVLDIKGSELQVYKLDRGGNRIAGRQPNVKFDHVQKIERYHNIMFVTAMIAGKTLYFCLDTGAESNVLHIGNPKKVINTVTITRRSNMRGVGEAQKEILYGILNDFTIGKHHLGPMETILTDLSSMSEFYETQIDGMLGYDFFQRGKIYFNLVKQEMGICFTPGG